MTATFPDVPATATTASLVARRNPARRGPVVLAVDGTDTSNAPVIAARTLALRLDVPLRVVTVIEPYPLYAGAVGMWPIPMPPESDMRQAREEGVRRYVSSAMGGDKWQLDTRLGQTAREIRDFARELDASMIVMGAAPHRVFGHTAAGTRASQVLRGAPCPVLSVIPSFNDLPQRVVAAIDFSAASMRAAQAALLMIHPEGTLTLVNVVTTPELPPAPGRPGVTEALDTHTAKWFARLREQLAPYTPPNVIIETRVTEGAVVAEVLEYASTLGADMIAVGTHGPGLVERMFLGSTASDVLHLSLCSVLASPAPKAIEALDLELQVAGTTTTAKPEEWEKLLDAISKRDAGRVVTVEVDDRDFGAQVEASGYVLRGITYDPHDRRVAIMVEAPDGGGGHLTRSVSNVDTIGVVSGPGDQDRAVTLRHGRGQTLLLMAS